MRRSDSPIDPVHKERHVPLDVADAFELFTLGMGWDVELAPYEARAGG